MKEKEWHCLRHERTLTDEEREKCGNCGSLYLYVNYLKED